jgi:hypothetical protein
MRRNPSFHASPDVPVPQSKGVAAATSAAPPGVSARGPFERYRTPGRILKLRLRAAVAWLGANRSGAGLLESGSRPLDGCGDQLVPNGGSRRCRRAPRRRRPSLGTQPPLARFRPAARLIGVGSILRRHFEEGYALDRTWRQAETASGAMCLDDRMHELRRPDDRVDRARLDAQRTAYALLLAYACGDGRRRRLQRRFQIGTPR